MSSLFLITVIPDVATHHEPARIPVTKRWEDLQAQPSIDVGAGVKIRLGLEGARVPQWSGVLLYCLAEGYAPPSGGSGKTPFGPVHADFAFAGEKKAAQFMRWGSNGKRPMGTYLYVRALPISRVGTYQVMVTDRQGKVLAAAPVEGTRDSFHPWMPWLKGLAHPEAPWEGIALPTVNTLGPVLMLEPGEARKGRLPTLLPSAQEPTLTIAKEGKVVVIRAETAFTTSRPDYHFLARWWVNGKPFVPKQIDQFRDFAGYGLVSEGKELRVEFDFHPERLGATRGDKIGLQLMHSEGAWNWCADSHLGKRGASRSDNVRVSNRIDFEVPK